MAASNIAKALVFAALIYIALCSGGVSPALVCFQSGACDDVVTDFAVTDTADACLSYCQSHPTCRYFTFYQDTALCFVFETCDVIDVECPFCVYGERECAPTQALTLSKVVLVGGVSRSDISLVSLPSHTDNTTGTTCSDPTEYPLAVHSAVVAMVNYRIMGCGGHEAATNVRHAGCFQFDPEKQIWLEVPSLPSPARAYSAVLHVDQTHLWVSGGLQSNGTIEDFIPVISSLDTTTMTWAAGPQLPFGIARHCMCLLPDGRVVTAGGERQYTNGIPEPPSAAFVYSASVWTELPSLAELRTEPACAYWRKGDGSEHVIVAGGHPSLRMVEAFDLASSTWRRLPDLPVDTMAAIIVNDQNNLVLVNAHSNAVLSFDESTETFNLLPESDTAGTRAYSAAAPVADAALYGCHL